MLNPSHSAGVPALWQRPRVPLPPPGFEDAARALARCLADIAARHPRAALASSLSAEDLVLTHALGTARLALDVFVIDTGRLHPETLALLDAVPALLGRPAIVVRPDAAAVDGHVAVHGAFAFYESVEQRRACCHLRKVEPLARALDGRDAWLTGQRRAHGPERAELPVQEHDAARGIAKFNPLADWSDDAVWHYVDRFRLPVNALHRHGYPSIGCEPCTRPVRAGEDPRAGRWWWEQHSVKECGLHRHADAPAVAS